MSGPAGCRWAVAGRVPSLHLAGCIRNDLGKGEYDMDVKQKTWENPRVECLDLAQTLGGVLANSDNGAMSNNAFPNPS